MDLLRIFKTDHDGIRKSHVKNLICVAMADGRLDQSEWDFLVSIARVLGVTEDQIDEIRRNPEAVRFIPPRKYEEKVVQLHDLVAVMTLDGVINSRELELCKKISLRLDLLPQVVDEILDNILPPDRPGPGPH